MKLPTTLNQPTRSIRYLVTRCAVIGLTWICTCIAFAQTTADPSAPARQLQVLSTLKVTKSGIDVTYNKATPPPPISTPKEPTPTLRPLEPAEPTAEKFVSMTLSFFPHQEIGTELSWMDGEDRIHRAYSNVDFSNFPAAFSYTFNGTFYSVMFMLGVVRDPSPSSQARATANMAEIKSQLDTLKSYDYVQAGSALTNEGKETLDMLHAYYAINRGQLIEDRRRREIEAEVAQREQERKSREPVVVNYWKKTSNANKP